MESVVSSIRFFPLPISEGYDNIWDVMASRSGPIYVSACCEAHERDGYRLAKNTLLYAFDPVTERFSLAVDLEALTGHRFDGNNIVHGKVHFSLCEGADGTIYGGTHLHTISSMKEHRGDRFAWWEQLTRRDSGFPGGTLFAYHPQTGQSEVLAIPQPHQGIRVMTIDERRGRIYGIGFPWSNLWRYDLATGECRNLGEVPYHNPYGLAVDRHGRVFTLSSRGEIMRYDPQDDLLVTLPVMVPGVGEKGETLCELRMRRSGDSMIGSTLLGSRAFEYFPYDGPAGRIRDLGQVYPLAEGAQYNVLEAMIEGGDGWLYFPVVVGRERSHEARLVRLNPVDGRTEDLGRIMIGDEPVRGTYRGALGTDRKLYFAALKTVTLQDKLMLAQVDPSELPLVEGR